MEETIDDKLNKSAMYPSPTDPIAPIPKASPTVNPDIVPIFPGTSSCAYTTVTEKLVIKIKPVIVRKRNARTEGTKGIRMANGTVDNIENEITFFLPKRSASGPPKKVPKAPAIKKANKKSCDSLIVREYSSIAKKA